MIRSILKFIGILVSAGFTMILLASVIPALQNTVYGFATYIVPWILAFRFTAKKKTVIKKQDHIESEREQKHRVAASATTKQADQQAIGSKQPASRTYAPNKTTPKSANNSTPSPAALNPEKTDTKTRTYKVAGVTHYVDNIMSLAVENSNYDLSKRELIDDGMIEEKIWKYEFYPSRLELTPEPDNPHDPNAIKVIIDGKHVGYIKEGSCAHIRNLMKQGTVVQADCKIGGGPYKYISEDYDYDKDKEAYELERSSTNFFVHLEITERV